MNESDKPAHEIDVRKWARELVARQEFNGSSPVTMAGAYVADRNGMWRHDGQRFVRLDPLAFDWTSGYVD